MAGWARRWDGGVKEAKIECFPNIWWGTSVENQEQAEARIPFLLSVPAAIRWISAEPLLGSLDLNRWSKYENKAQRREDLSGHSRGAPDHRQKRAHLESSITERKPLEQRKSTHPASHTQKSGEQNREGLSSGKGDVRRKKDSCIGAQTGLPTLPRDNPPQPYRESRERKEGGQSAEESGISHTVGTDKAHDTNPQKRARSQPERGKERDGEADEASCEKNPSSPGCGREAEIDRSRFRDIRSSSEQNSQERALGISWIVCGGESGPGARRMDPAWVREILAQCHLINIPVFVKQLGSVWAKENGAKNRKGEDPKEWPADLRVREWPSIPERIH